MGEKRDVEESGRRGVAKIICSWVVSRSWGGRQVEEARLMHEGKWWMSHRNTSGEQNTQHFQNSVLLMYVGLFENRTLPEILVICHHLCQTQGSESALTTSFHIFLILPSSRNSSDIQQLALFYTVLNQSIHITCS